MLKFAIAAAAAFAFFATPASACDDCKGKKETTAQADKKEEKGCHCTKEGGKCKCGDKCTCDHCKEKGDKKDAPKKA
jgi:hypothetical protein